MTTDIYLSKSEKETKELAGSLLEKHWDTLRKKTLLFALEGELGTGKTVFAKGVGEYLGIKRPIRSPGFVLVAEYPYIRLVASSTPSRKHLGGEPQAQHHLRGGGIDGFSLAGKLFHVDLWRIEDENEARALRLEEMIKPGNIILIEWAQRIPNFLDELRQRNDLKAISVKFAHKREKEREITIVDS